jgi:hypothetical protein
MIDTASAFMIAGAALQAIPAGRAVVFFMTRRPRADDFRRLIAILPSQSRGLRSSS